MRKRAAEQLARLGVTIDPASQVQQLTHGNRQLVAIGRALMLDARVLIMDEPTASLDEWEAQRLLGVVSALRASGVAVLYVSHRLPEILQIADVVSVMRDGRLVEERAVPGLRRGVPWSRACSAGRWCSTRDAARRPGTRWRSSQRAWPGPASSGRSTSPSAAARSSAWPA